MGYMSGYIEPPEVDVEPQPENPPSYDEVLDANERLASIVSRQATQIQVLEIELAALKRRVRD